jgi:hypothetical protein
MFSNHSMQRFGASGLGHFQNLHLGSLAPTADAGRWASHGSIIAILPSNGI